MDLLGRWTALIGSGSSTLETGSRLIGAWSEPHRRYHAIGHLRAVLDRIDELDAAAETATVTGTTVAGGPAPSAVARLAAWYHDAVYRPGATDNEAASAAMAVADLRRLGWAPDAVAEVERLVLVTVEHRSDRSDRPGALLCDADLAVLGSDPAGYDRYRTDVRAEYAEVDADGWRRGRAAVLQGLLGRERLYATGEGSRRWEAPARRNLTAELVALTAGG